MKISFTVIDGPGLGTIREFTEPGSYMIGRALDMDYRLPEDDPYVGRRHVIIEIAPPSARIKDLQSKNPPHLNGHLTREADLRDGDELELGFTRFRVRIDSEIAKRTGRCGGCGSIVPLLGDEVEPTRCPACPPQAIRSAGTVTCACHVCRADRSNLANADGRAAELGDDVLYCCPTCLPANDEHQGRRFGDYRVIRRLGGGGMGDVYLVEHQATARLLVAKEVNNIGVKDLAVRFDREARYMQECLHPALVRHIDHGIGEDDKPYLVMQYIPDGSLDDLLAARSAPWSPSEAVPKFLSVLEGLAHFHERGFIHRDIKPGNILLDSRRGSAIGCALLADFGLAYCHTRAGTLRITRRNAGMGTLLFMAPEQARNAAGAKEAADVYSLGVTLYYALTGHYSLDFPTPAQVIRHVRNNPALWPKINPEKPDQKILMEEASFLSLRLILDPDVKPIPILTRRPDLPPNLARAIDRSVRKEVDARFNSAVAMRDAIATAIS
jgi:eukaryotic-like serine/threonine-protein kinase